MSVHMKNKNADCIDQVVIIVKIYKKEKTKNTLQMTSFFLI